MSTNLVAMTLPRQTSASPIQRLIRFLHTAKGALSLVFLPLLGLAGAAAGGWSVVAPHVAAALLGAALAELLIVRVERGSLFWPSSALLSGLIVAFVLGPETPRLTTVAVGTLATASKYVLRTRRGQIFNPAGLALLAAIPLFGIGQSWWGALPDLPWPGLLLLLAGGVFVVDRIDRFPLVLTFLGSYFGLFTLLALGNPARVAEIFRTPFLPAALFLALFMLTDPPTAPGRTSHQIWIGALAASVAVGSQLLGAGQSYLLIGLLSGNLALAGLRWLNGRPRRSSGSPPRGPGPGARLTLTS
jgi:Na+-translocating ferredoxin:NAD+ oxidoreductase RnfD subunit